jgi:hypothetical protein
MALWVHDLTADFLSKSPIRVMLCDGWIIVCMFRAFAGYGGWFLQHVGWISSQRLEGMVGPGGRLPSSMGSQTCVNFPR